MASYTQLQDVDIRDIVRQYDLTAVTFAPMDGGAGNSSFVLYTEQGKYVLTAFDDKTLGYVTNLGRLLTLLATHDFPTTRLLPPTQGHGAIVHNGKPMMVKEYITGQVHPELDTTMLRQAGAAMARLHQIPVPEFLPCEHPYGRQLFGRVVGRDIDPAYERWLDERCAYLDQHIPAGLPVGLIHGDMFYDNVLFEEGRFKAVIDFEEACHYYRAFDVGMGIVGLCAEGPTVPLRKAQALVAGYQEVRRLKEVERVSLQLFVEYAAIATSYWRFWKYHIHVPMPEHADAHWEMVRLARGVRSIPKTSFVETVVDGRGGMREG